MVFNRIFDGDYFYFRRVDFLEEGVKSGGFSAACRAGVEYHAVGLLVVPS